MRYNYLNTMLFFIHGEDTYRSRQKLAELKNEFKRKLATSDFSITVLDGEKLTLEDFREAVATSSFLAKKRFIIIENLLSKNSQLNLKKNIAKYLYEENIQLDNSVVFWEAKDFQKKNSWSRKKSKTDHPAAKTGSPLLAKLLKEQYVWYFPLLTNSELTVWLRRRATELNGQLTSQTANALIALIGNDLWQLDQELKKLVAYCQQRPITLKEINLLVHGNFTEDIFRLTDAVGSQNKKLALQLLNQQLTNREPGGQAYTFSMIVRQFRLLLQIKDALARQIVSPASLAKELGLHPFVVKKILPQASKYTLEQLKNIYQKLLTIDFKVKTGQGGLELLLDMLIAETK